jgi:hypothetical protein
MPVASTLRMSTRSAAWRRPVRLLLVGSVSSTWSDTWRLITQRHPHWRVNVTASPESACRYLDENAVDAVIAGLSEVDARMATVLAAARSTHPTVRRIAVVDSATRSHPEARQASAVVEHSPPQAFVSKLGWALARP